MVGTLIAQIEVTTMKYLSLIAALLFPIARIPQQRPKPAPQQPEKPQLAELNSGADPRDPVVSVRGVWRPDNLTKENEPVEADTELTCFRHGGKDIVGTEAFCCK